MEQHITQNTSGKGNTKEYIVLHHTGSENVAGTIARFKNPKSKVSAHYVIGKDGKINKFNTDDDILRHCGASSRDGKTSLNKYSIGIEIVGIDIFSDEQRKSARSLISDLMKKYNINYKSIIRHKDIAPTRKVDISDSFWFDNFQSFTEYQESYLSEYEKKIKEIMKKNSELWVLCNDLQKKCAEETKKVMEKEKEILNQTNDYFRSVGY